MEAKVNQLFPKLEKILVSVTGVGENNILLSPNFEGYPEKSLPRNAEHIISPPRISYVENLSRPPNHDKILRTGPPPGSYGKRPTRTKTKQKQKP